MDISFLYDFISNVASGLFSAITTYDLKTRLSERKYMPENLMKETVGEEEFKKLSRKISELENKVYQRDT